MLLVFPISKSKLIKKNVQLFRQCGKFGIKLTMLEFKKKIHRYKQYRYLPRKNIKILNPN